jgi:hypothetical protein
MFGDYLSSLQTFVFGLDYVLYYIILLALIFNTESNLKVPSLQSPCAPLCLLAALLVSEPLSVGDMHV